MPEPTRREVLVGAALLLTPVAAAQDSKPTEPVVDIGPYEKNLAKPLDDLAKEKLKAAIAYSQTVHKQRMDFKLPENSEPCTRYIPSGQKSEKSK